MRPGVRIRDARRLRRAGPVRRPRPGAAAGERRASTVADLAVPGQVDPRRGASRGCWSSRRTESGTRGLRSPAGRAAPAVDARPAQRRAAPGARPAQRPDAADAGTSTATTRRCGCGWTRRTSSPRCGCGSSSASRRPPGRRWSWPPPRCSGIVRELLGRQWEPLSMCFTHRAPAIARRPPRGVRAAAAVRARVHRAGLLRRPSSTPRTRCPTRCCGPTPQQLLALGAPPRARR